MKSIKLFVVCINLLLPFLAWGQSNKYFQYEGIRYRIVKEADEFTSYGQVSVTPLDTDKYKGNIIIPNVVKESNEEYADTYKVVSIDEQAFAECDSLISVKLSASIETMGENAFYDSSVESIVIPYGNLTDIPKNAFYAAGLKSLILPGSIRTIGDDAFAHCNLLISVESQGGVKSIGNRAFLDCINLTSVTFQEGLETIGMGAFNGCFDLSSVTLPQTLKSIGKSAFSKCSSLKEITLPDGLADIHESAFGNSGLESIILPESLTYIDGDAFCYCEYLKNITLRNNINQIKDFAFISCSSLQYIVIPESVSTIGFGLFIQCAELQAVYFKSETPPAIIVPENYIGMSMMDEAYPDIKIYVPHNSVDKYKNAKEWSQYADIIKGYDFTVNDPAKETYVLKYIRPQKYAKYKGSEITIPKGIEIIGEAAFCKALLETINLPSTVTTIHDYAFAQCPKLKYINFPDTVSELGNGIFSQCASIEKVTIPKGVNAIPQFSFYECSNLMSVILPEGVTIIDKSAFEGCEKLTEVIIPEGVTELGEHAFSNCINLKRVILPSTLKEIGYGAFSECKSLEEIVIPASVNKIQRYAFARCHALSKVTIEGSTKDWEKYIFSTCENLKEVIISIDIIDISPNDLGIDGKILKAQNSEEDIAVDLGLSVRWGSKNLGADSKYEIGSLYAWGETSAKKEFTEASYTLKQNGFFIKYCVEEKYGSVDNCRQLSASDDAATATLGKKWRLPTEAECRELLEKCKWEYIKDYSKNMMGFMVTGPSGKSIFIPHTQAGNLIWSASMGKSFLGSTPFGCTISFNPNEQWGETPPTVKIANIMRFNGIPVRAVTK